MTERIPPIYRQNRAFWEGKKAEYPFHAHGSLGIKSPEVDSSVGDHISAVMVPNSRTFSFKTEAARDLFVEVFGATPGEKIE